MKHTAVLAFVFLTIFATVYCQQSHNVTWGFRGIYDVLLYKDYIIEPKKWLRVVTRDVTYPKQGIPNYYNITEIKVTDLFTNGTGGYVYITQGGLNYRNVTLHFKSQRSQGMSFLLEIYGRK